MSSSFLVLAAAFTAATLLLNVVDGALLEKGPRLERLIRLLHALFELFEHLLPSVWVGLLVVIHRLHKRHIEVLRGKLTLLQQLFVFVEVVDYTFGASLVMTSFDCDHSIIVFVVLTVLEVVVIIAFFFSFLSFTRLLCSGCRLSSGKKISILVFHLL